MAMRFGLRPEQFGENIRDNYQRHEVDQCPMEPKQFAEEFVSGYVLYSTSVKRLCMSQEFVSGYVLSLLQ